MSEFRAFFCLWNGYEEKKAIQLGNTRTSDTSCEGSRTTERKLLADKEKKEREKKKEDQKKKMQETSPTVLGYGGTKCALLIQDVFKRCR